MDYKEALKQVSTKKTKDNYLLIEIGFHAEFILPYKAGIQFLESLETAEEIRDKYSKPRVSGVDFNTFEVHFLSEENYKRYKIADLMQVTFTDVKYAEEANKS